LLKPIGKFTTNKKFYAAQQCRVFSAGDAGGGRCKFPVNRKDSRGNGVKPFTAFFSVTHTWYLYSGSSLLWAIFFMLLKISRTRLRGFL
jgi:hypothetical protein